MSKIFSYNFEKFSSKDIVESLVKNGQEVIYQIGNPGSKERGFVIKGTPIIIQYPPLNDIKYIKFYDLYSLAGSVKWENRKYRYGLLDLKKIGIKSLEEFKKHKEYYSLTDDDFFTPEDYKRHEQLFLKLKKKFQMKKGEKAQVVKDLDWLLGIEKTGKLIL